MAHSKRKKLNLNVKKEFQRWLLGRIFLAVILSAVVAALILYGYARTEICDSFYTAHVAIRRVSDLLWPVVLAGSAVSLLSGMLLAVFLPQKIAGPLFRIEEDLKAIGKGDLTVTITLRSGDTLQDFAASINETVAELRERVKKAQDGCVDLESSEAGRQMTEVQRQGCAALKSLKT